jgi:glycosyltransferase involved in cell wall biosynthesis
MFSILIPTWNNLSYVKLCVASIRKNSTFRHQVILHINDGSDGTLEWAQHENITYTHSKTNIGICKAVNLSSHLAVNDYIVYMNDDMYVCPQWDQVLLKEINKLASNCFMLSATMIEPHDTGNRCVIVHNYGTALESFKEEALLQYASSHAMQNWCGSAWPPTVVHKHYWDLVGGYSEEFSPGMSSDDDFAMKMYHQGCRIFKGVAKSRVYHFQAKSTQRVVRNNGRVQFLHKWKMHQSFFNTSILRRGEKYTSKWKEVSFLLLSIEKIRVWITLLFSSK